MKNLLLLTLLIPSFLMAMHHKSEPIIFYLDMDVTEDRAESLDEFVKYLETNFSFTDFKTSLIRIL